MNQLIGLASQQLHCALQSVQLKRPSNLHVFDTIDSTNRYLKDLPISDALEICCAETQTQGRGRFARQWHSPPGVNIYCSTRWPVYAPVSQLAGLSLVSSLAVLTTAKECMDCSALKIKWPNDIFWNDKKLSGCLIEIVHATRQPVQVIIGIGINVNADIMDPAWCSFYEITRHHFDRHRIIAALVSNLETYLDEFLVSGLQSFLPLWQAHDYLFGKEMSLQQGARTFAGKAAGITLSGELILVNAEGEHLFCK